MISVVVGDFKIPLDGFIRYTLPDKKYKALILSSFKVPNEILCSEEISHRCSSHHRSIHTVRRHVRVLVKSGILEKVRILKNNKSIVAYRVKQ